VFAREIALGTAGGRNEAGLFVLNGEGGASEQRAPFSGLRLSRASFMAKNTGKKFTPEFPMTINCNAAPLN
jgi:hypothetical protein